VIVETDGANGSGGVARLTSYRTGSILTHEASVGLFVKIDSFHSTKVRKTNETTKLFAFFLDFAPLKFVEFR
jgi:hypothetical protein